MAKPIRSKYSSDLSAAKAALKLFREHRGMTQAELAKRAGLSALYVSQLETKRRAGSQATLRKIATVLEVDIDLLAPR